MAPPQEHDTDESTPLLNGKGDAQDAHAAQPGPSSGAGGNDAAVPSPPATTRRLPKSSTNASWGDPEGLPMRGASDEDVVIFRQALGINSAVGNSSSGSGSGNNALDVEAGRRRATGVYAAVLSHQRSKRLQYLALLGLIYGCHFTQIVVSAALTVLGPSAQDHKTSITALGATNTIVAGFLALITQQGLAEKLHKDEVEFKKLQAWIEETEALLALGIIARDRRDVGALVESAFRRYNAAEAREETNQPDAFIPAGDLPAHQQQQHALGGEGEDEQTPLVARRRLAAARH